MSLQVIDSLLNDWKNPNYIGLEIKDYPPVINIELKRNKLMKNKTRKDMEQMKYIKPNPYVITHYKDPINNLYDFHRDYNFAKVGKYKYRIIDDYINTELFDKYIKKNIKNMLEIGFNTGEISGFLLHRLPHIEVTSIEYNENLYSWYAKAFIDELFPTRHIMLTGLPHEVINSIHFGQPILFKYDLVIINTNCPNLYNIITKIKEYSHENTIVIINKVCPHTSYGLYPYMVMKKLIHNNILNFIEHNKTDKHFTNGIAILKYNFGDIKSEQNNLKLSIYKEIESGIPLSELRKFIQERQEDQFADNFMIKTYIQKLMAEGIRIDKELIKLIKEKFNINI